MEINFNEFVVAELSSGNILVTPEDRFIYNGTTYVYLKDLPDDVLKELRNNIVLTPSEHKVSGRILISNYVALTTNNGDEIKDIVTDIDNDKRIFVEVDNELYYVLDYDNI